MRKYSNRVPSVFIVSSPFQALCAVAAMTQYKIKDYKIIAIFFKGNSRNSQLSAVLDKYGIQFDVVYYESSVVSYLKTYLKSLRHVGNIYKRLFIGNIGSTYSLILGCQYVSDDSEVIYLDDGGATLSILQKGYKLRNPLDRFMVFLLSKMRRVVVGKHFLTIFEGFTNNELDINILDFRNVIKNKCQNPEDGQDIIIVGTNTESYCESLNISEDFFLCQFEKFLLYLKNTYKHHNIIMYRHGRDNNSNILTICKNYKCEVITPNMTIELTLINRPLPLAIYGFTSTALYTLKKMFNTIEIYNILMKGDDTQSSYWTYLELTKYYEENGIRCIKNYESIR